jgi:hypothetical protein
VVLPATSQVVRFSAAGAWRHLARPSAPARACLGIVSPVIGFTILRYREHLAR